MSTNYSEMSYTELQAAAKEAGLPANKTKDELVAALVAAQAGDAPAETETPETPEEAETGDEAEAEEPAEATDPAGAADATVGQSEKDVEKALREDKAKMKAHLDAQDKVKVMIPFDAGVDPAQAKKIPFVVNINGYRLAIPRGVMVDVPQQVADIVAERLESENKVGEEYRLDRDPAKMEALG